MNELSDLEFEAWLDAVARGEKLPDDLPAEDAADLAFGRRLLALRTAPSQHLESTRATAMNRLLWKSTTGAERPVYVT